MHDDNEERCTGFDWLTPKGVDEVLRETEAYQALLTAEQERPTHAFDAGGELCALEVLPCG